MIRNLLPQLMARKGVSIRQLSRDTGITYSTIWAMVHSQRRSVQLEVLDAVCAALDVQPGDIYWREGPGQEYVAAPEARPAAARVAQPEQKTSATTRKDGRREWRSW